ncbi:putative phosphodiesterase 10A [Danaus plexippus plexippus]|uniref:Phosphodiesterase 10A n=1 Tax=Danaus plexippus plexippus TaxID=278856 RepID=A0A212FD25_DANPL|nr:cAMP and cAMP-inhibited cGMP 3',5'-cyclic phosphodiesterase 10A-like isoform X2 [Danaus plexippus plexippus]OWR51617.1 putative phosphodiesterase 10A [Danaus plexippus plexippus]
MLSGLCHDLDHPGYNNNFLSLCKHPLALMYRSSMLEYHHYFLAKKVIEDKKLLINVPLADRERILEEMKYDILCTDLAIYFQVRAQLTPLVAECCFDWTDNTHRSLLKGDKERRMGYTPLSMMDRRRSVNQPAEQIQFLSVVVLPCLLLLQNIFPNTAQLTENCRKTQEAWHEEIEIRGQKLWRQDDSIGSASRTRLMLKADSEIN